MHLHAIAQRNESSHRGKLRDRQQNHRSSQHHDHHQAMTNINTQIAPMNHPAANHGHTGALMYGPSTSEGRGHSGSPAFSLPEDDGASEHHDRNGRDGDDREHRHWLRWEDSRATMAS